MITARQFKNGFVVKMDKNLFLVLGSQHIKPGKGGAFVRVKLKNLKTGSIALSTFRPDESFPQAFIEQKKMQYLYHDDSIYHFMDQETYEQTGLQKSILGNSAKFLKDGMEITASLHEDTIVEISLPQFIHLKVTYTEPGIKGDTAGSSLKPATLETGAIIRVPLFINQDATIKIDTRTGTYAGRA